MIASYQTMMGIAVERSSERLKAADPAYANIDQDAEVCMIRSRTLGVLLLAGDADKNVLKQIADPTGGQEYDSSPENIQTIYDQIATFF